VVVAEELGEVLTFELVPNFRLLGPRLGEDAKHLRGALAELDGGAAAAALESGDPVTVELAGGPVALGPDEVELRVKGQPGFAVSREGGEVVALDLAIDEDLRRRGLVREVVRLVQDLRKSEGLEVSDRIELWLAGLDELSGWHEAIGREVLAPRVHEGPGEGEGHHLGLDEHPEARVWLVKA
jgi:isoleucyl-tRNA synthetase